MQQNEYPRPTPSTLTRQNVQVVVKTLIRNRLPFEDFYRLAAAYQSSPQRETIAYNEELAWKLLCRRMDKHLDSWWYGTYFGAPGGFDG